MFTNDWGIKSMGKYLTHKLIKMAKGKFVDEKVLKGKKWLLSEKKSNKAINKKELFLKLCSIILPTLLVQKPKNSKIFPTFAFVPL